MEQKRLEHLLGLMVREACANPGTFGESASLEEGGPLDSDCLAVWLAARLRAGGAKVRLVVLKRQASYDSIAEVWHPLARTWLEVNPLRIRQELCERVAERELPAKGEAP